MEENQHPPIPRPASGGLLRLQASLTNPLVWLGPAWAALCGVAASGGLGQDWMRLALLILLVDGGWGTLWAALSNTDWATPLRRWRNYHLGEPVPPLPYTLPDSPGDRASRWLGQLRAWWRDVLWPACGSELSAITAALSVTVVLAMLLGPKLVLLSLAALAMTQLSIAWNWGDAIVAVLLPWLAGHVAFAPSTPASAGLALAFTLAWGANRRAASTGMRGLGIAAQLAALILLVALRHPLAVGAVALLLVPQLALLPWLRRGQSASWYARHTRPWLMAAMLVASCAL